MKILEYPRQINVLGGLCHFTHWVKLRQPVAVNKKRQKMVKLGRDISKD
jgi:hypothetical protein